MITQPVGPSQASPHASSRAQGLYQTFADEESLLSQPCVVEIPLGLAENPVIPLSECPPPTAIPTLEFATNLTLPRKAPNLGPFKSIKVVEPSTIYLKDGSGATLVELDVELKVD